MMQHEDAPIFYIYEIRHKVDQGGHKAGECLYAGVTKHPEKRWREHQQEARRGKHSRKCCSIRKWGPENFELVIVRDLLTRAEADAWEQATIAANRELGEAPANIGDGGGIGDLIVASRLGAAARSMKPKEWRTAVALKRINTMGPERRSAAARKAKENMGPERRRAATLKARQTLGLEGRSAAMRKRAANINPETRRASALKAKQTLGPDARRAVRRKQIETLGEYRCKAIARKARATQLLLKQLGFVNKEALRIFLTLEPEHTADYACLGLI